MDKKQLSTFSSLVGSAQRIVIIQADNPDGDSLCSSLALEHILGDLGKDVVMYCGVDMPTYLQIHKGYDRVVKNLPSNFELSIIVDTSALKLLEQLDKTGQLAWVKSKNCVVLDHHTTASDIDFATVQFITTAVATGELIFDLCGELKWQVSLEAASFLACAIMSDSLGLTTDKTSPNSFRVMADLVEKGVSIPDLEEARRASMRKSPEITHYKGLLLQRIEYHDQDRIATIVIPWEEIEKYSQAYNPSMLAIDDMRLTTNTSIAIAFKTYPYNGRVTAKIRANQSGAIADKLAEHFGGGGHPCASGFKVEDGRSFEDIKAECIAKTTELLNTI